MKKVNVQPSQTLSKILKHPDIYIERNVTLEGIVQSVDLRKVSKDVTILTLNLSPYENLKILLGSGSTPKKYQFMHKLSKAEDAYLQNRYTDILVRRKEADEMRRLACEMKIAADKLNVMEYSFRALNKNGIAAALKKVSKGYSILGDAYFSFHKAAFEGSPELEKGFAEEKLKNIGKFETGLQTGAELFLSFSKDLIKSQEMISQGVYSFEYDSFLKRQSSLEILTHASLVNAASWEKFREGDISGDKSLKSVAAALKQLGDGDGQINEGLKEVSLILEKTAVDGGRTNIPALKCAYYGLNGGHLRRCAKTLKNLKKHIPVKIEGRLVRSNLREEVDVLWLQAKVFEVDGLVIPLEYGDSSSALKGAMDLYDWVEQVEKGKGK
ncbi:MAG: hypothetical protein HRT88_24205 [Lentisphaeraceae bacterium]|nr:hypothetical protein [Lentisphaeraceae bacterium]